MKFASSHLLARLQPHSRLRLQSSAYADGELSAAALERFEKHLQSCIDCSRSVEAARATKTLLAALPMEAAPRSFRLTPQMVAAPVPELRPRRLAPLRLAQGTAVFAAVGLLAVVTVGAFQGGSSDSTTTAADASLTSSNERKAEVPKAASAGSAATDQPSPTANTVTGSALSVGAATAGPAADAPVPPRTGAEQFSGAATATVAPSGDALSDGRFAASPEAARDAGGQPALTQHGETGDRVSGRRWIEFALLGVIALSGIAWLALSRRNRRENP